jgi:hypothetical protein
MDRFKPGSPCWKAGYLSWNLRLDFAYRLLKSGLCSSNHFRLFRRFRRRRAEGELDGYHLGRFGGIILIHKPNGCLVVHRVDAHVLRFKRHGNLRLRGISSLNLSESCLPTKRWVCEVHNPVPEGKNIKGTLWVRSGGEPAARPRKRPTQSVITIGCGI